MAQKVTRTIKGTEVTILGMDVVKCEPFNETITLPETYKNEKNLVKAIREIVDTDEKKFVQVVDEPVVTEKLYEMPMALFMKTATVTGEKKSVETSENK